MPPLDCNATLAGLLGERCFSHAGLKAWNALPAELQDLTDHSAFKRQLQTFLFERAFTT